MESFNHHLSMFHRQHRLIKLGKLWFWTLLTISGALVVICWTSVFLPVAFPWNPKSVFSLLVDFSSKVIMLLFLSLCVGWRKERALALASLMLCLLWVLWAGLPRI
jgi:hypothetical protein